MPDDPKALYEKAVDYFTMAKYDEAIATLKTLLTLEPASADAHESLGMIYFKQGNLDEAIAWTQKLTQIDPNHSMAYTNLSVFYMKKGWKEKAEEAKAKATVLNFGKK